MIFLMHGINDCDQIRKLHFVAEDFIHKFQILI